MDFNSIINNWNNTLSTTFGEQFSLAQAKCEKMKKQGLKQNDIREVLSADGLNDPTINEVIGRSFGKSTLKEKLKKASYVSQYVVPTSYEDIKLAVENTLFKFGPEKLITFLTSGDTPIIKTSATHIQRIKKIATQSLEDSHALQHLHDELEPYMEEQMLHAVLEAEHGDAEIKKVSSDQYMVKMNNRTAMVDLSAGQSSSKRYSESHYDKFGLADEFIIKAHDKVSPCSRIIKH